MRRRIFCLLFLGCFGLAACRRDQIQTYTIPKESQPAVLGVPSKDLVWKIPAGWKEQAPSSMRMGSFLIKGSNGQSADMSVVPLSGDAGGDLANINRWRGQINLGPISAADLSIQGESITAGGRKMVYVNFVSHDRMINNHFKKRLMAAIYHQGDRTWFFKMLGDDTTVLDAKRSFMQFLKSLKFNEN